MKYSDYGYDCPAPEWADQVEFLTKEEALLLAKTGASIVSAHYTKEDGWWGRQRGVWHSAPLTTPIAFDVWFAE